MVPSSPSPGPGGALTVDHYTVRRKLGTGSMGSVYLAEDRRSRRLVALKVIRADRLSPPAVERMREEFQAISRLHHPQIAAAFDFGYTRGNALPYYTREYIEGTPLPPGPPAGARPGEFLRPILDLLDALDYLHAHHVLHLDIHPGNLIVARDPGRGGVLIDFSLLLGSPKESRFSTAPESLLGLPPELARGEQPTPATDIFLAGSLLLYRITGEAAGEPRLPDEVPSWGPRRTLELERIVAKALRPDPRQRFSSAAEFREALSRAIGEPHQEPRRLEPGEVTVGRSAELDRIEEALRKAQSGESAVLWITGTPGLGRSRLLAEARLRGQLQGLETVLATFFPETGAGPTLVRALGGIGAGRRRRPSWLDLLAAEHGGAPEEKARRAAREFFEEGGKPLALLLDDLDRADPQSRTLAEALLAECAERAGRGEKGRGLAVVVSTVGPPPAGPWRGKAHRLRPLAAAEGLELLRVLARPLELPEGLARNAARSAGGSPLRLRQIARAISAEWGRARKVPRSAELPALPIGLPTGGPGHPPEVDPAGRRVLSTLALLRYPARVEELAAALDEEPARVRKALRRLTELELAAAARRGGARHYQLGRPEAGDDLQKALSAKEVRRIHRRLAAHFQTEPRPDLATREKLACHLLLAGRRAEGLQHASRTARDLREAGLFERAVDLLREAQAAAGRPRTAFALAEDASAILEEIGDHRRGAALLEPFYAGSLDRLSSKEAIRLRRRLGVHYHRSGRSKDAVRIFEETQRLADPARDIEDLIFIDSELAEIHNLHGSQGPAEEACRRGLERLRGLSGDFRDRMELILRASRGHLELRRMDLTTARADLKAALKLCRRFHMPQTRAILLNNLGIAENQLNLLTEAQRSFRSAERVLLASGERRPLVAIACNLSMIAAKLGDREEAEAQIERAVLLLRHSSGERSEFFVECTRGVLACLLGDAGAALEVLPGALAAGRRVGDFHLVRLGEIYLAEACLASGRYGQALKIIRAAADERPVPPAMVRMVQARLFVLAVLLGHRRLARRARERLAEVPRTDVDLLEAWNDLWMGFGLQLAGEEAAATFRSALKTFRRLGVAFGERFARLGLLAEALRLGNRAEIEKELSGIAEGASEGHRLLAVAAPLAAAEAHLFLGDSGRARERLAEATGAIIGSPFLELDWRIELLRARLALKDGEPTTARGHLHQSLHSRELLLQLVPARWRTDFLAHPRFAVLNELTARLERSPRLFSSSRSLKAAGTFEGMVGRSAGMHAIFQAIDRLRDQDLPVLISGETGTGKELVARAVHHTSLRARRPFLALHCASLPVELFESELFGYEEGAFTGAEESRAGLLEGLAGGTLLLDGVSELPLEAQAKLLRVLESGAVRRLGGTWERPVDVRFLAATSADLRAMVAAGAFRTDLYYRLGGVEIAMPPLRGRREDVAPLAHQILAKHAKRLGRPAPRLEESGLRLLLSHHWPGNVRELETVLLRALVALSAPEPLGSRNLAPFIGHSGAGGLAAPAASQSFLNEELLEGRSLEDLHAELERVYLTRLFHRVEGDLKEMARRLGLKLAGLYFRLKKAGLDIRALRNRS